MSNSYTILSKYYDEFSSQDCDYVRWSQYLLNKAKIHNVKTAVDVACGTGKMTELLCQAGFSVTATDASSQMLNVASGKCKATFVLQDMRKLQILRKTDMVTCVNDGVNYLKPDELYPFFVRVADSLNDGAPFVFDISSQYKLTEILGNNIFYDDGDSATLLWTNKLGSRSVTMDITLFENQNGLYRRFDESHVQYIHKQFEVEQALKQAGFAVAEVTADYGLPLKPTSQRITFYAVKKCGAATE